MFCFLPCPSRKEIKHGKKFHKFTLFKKAKGIARLQFISIHEKGDDSPDLVVTNWCWTGIFDFSECYATPSAHFTHFFERLFLNFQFCYKSFMLVPCQAFRDHINHVDLRCCFCDVGCSWNFAKSLAISPPFKCLYFLGKCCNSSVKTAQLRDLLYRKEWKSGCFSLSWSAFWLGSNFSSWLTERVFTRFVSLMSSSTWLGPVLFLVIRKV